VGYKNGLFVICDVRRLAVILVPNSSSQAAGWVAQR